MDQIEIDDVCDIPVTNSPDQLLKNPNGNIKKETRLTALSKGGGCGCKIDSVSLHEMLANVPKSHSCKELLVGIEHSDDAAVFQVTENKALIFTNDFFTAIIDDPYTFGCVAASNSLSDVYAMGGEPLLANAIVGFPVDELSMKTMQEIMHGGVDVCKEAGIPLAGGHSIDNPQPIFGLAVVGIAHPKQIKINSGAQVGDMLILTKPLGIGIMASAFKLDLISDEGYKEFVKNITLLNKPGGWLGKQKGVNAMTDITGFGLGGHLLEMAKGAQVCFEIETSTVPVMKEALTHVVEGIVPSGAYRNMLGYGDELSFSDQWDSDNQLIFSDPQTNGGLLVSVEPAYAEQYVSELHDFGYEDVCIVGQVKEATHNKLPVVFM